MKRREFSAAVCGVFVVLAGCSVFGDETEPGNATAGEPTRNRTGSESIATTPDGPATATAVRGDAGEATATTRSDTPDTHTTQVETPETETTEGRTPETGTTRETDQYLARFRGGLEDDGIESLTVEGNTVFLTYVSTVQRPHEVASGIESITVRYAEVVGSGWEVDSLEATVVDAAGRPRGYWRVETDWVERLFADDSTRTELMERTLATFHGDLREDHDHHPDEGDHHTNERDHHTDERDDEHGDHEPTTARSNTSRAANASSDMPSARRR